MATPNHGAGSRWLVRSVRAIPATEWPIGKRESTLAFKVGTLVPRTGDMGLCRATAAQRMLIIRAFFGFECAWL
ncbi:hypothetical protein GCM10011410_06160 [Hoyosella rhizosphaerae]|uniref:Uncharacterized protein n=1 Tax=Hoyosella rhizosphaerae TaxID=1755582 RepID=A0A916U281_9ACTN|nr:hypothetical protein GCM10011410_06160 [Hoyosella rhizosphaerae]